MIFNHCFLLLLAEQTSQATLEGGDGRGWKGGPGGLRVDGGMEGEKGKKGKDRVEKGNARGKKRRRGREMAEEGRKKENKRREGLNRKEK